jgi:hypothetical protein
VSSVYLVKGFRGLEFGARGLGKVRLPHTYLFVLSGINSLRPNLTQVLLLVPAAASRTIKWANPIRVGVNIIFTVPPPTHHLT